MSPHLPYFNDLLYSLIAEELQHVVEKHVTVPAKY